MFAFIEKYIRDEIRGETCIEIQNDLRSSLCMVSFKREMGVLKNIFKKYLERNSYSDPNLFKDGIQDLRSGNS